MLLSITTLTTNEGKINNLTIVHSLLTVVSLTNKEAQKL